MALTDAQKSAARLYLGYSDGAVGGSPSALESALTALSATAQTQVGTILTSLATIETTLTAGWGRMKVVKAEEVTLAGEDELRALRNEGRRLVRQLSIIMGTQPAYDAFAVGGAMSGPCGRG